MNRLDGDAFVNGEKVFIEHLGTIERVISFACHRAGFLDADADDFGSFVKLKLIENDYSAITRFEGRCNFDAYMSVVVQRLLLDYRARLWGKWRPSAEAKRLGSAAMAIEELIVRDGTAIPDALRELRKGWPELTEESIEATMSRLPVRSRRPRSVAVELADAVAGRDDFEEAAFEKDRMRLGGRIGAIVRDAMESYSEQDRLICRLRFSGGLSLAEVSRLICIEQKPLYRRLQRLLSDLQRRLRQAGIDEGDAESIVSNRAVDLDFGWETEGMRSSNIEECSTEDGRDRE